MSALTAQLIAKDIVEKAHELMQEMPASWAATVDEEGQLSRHALTLGYLKACYAEATEALPASLGSAERGAVEKLFQELSVRCDEKSEYMESVIGRDTTNLSTVPKYYFSELRTVRKCSLPSPPEVYGTRALLSFLTVEAISNLRNVQRFGILADRTDSDASRECWKQLQELSSSKALLILRIAVQVYGEDKVLAEIEACAKDEAEIVLDIYEMRGSSSSATADTDDLDGGEDDFCLVQKPVFVVSDCTGESAERTVRCALGQFGHCFDRATQLDITTFRFCTEIQIEPIAEQARQRDALIVFTLVDPRVNATMVKQCEEYSVDYLDLWSPLLSKLEENFHANRLGVSGAQRSISSQYMELVECIEYTRALDDGVDPKRWKEADIMIIGPSRSGKTPLSFFMAQRGFKVANYPLVPDEDPPSELWDLKQERVFALTIAPTKLVDIRSNRMQTLKMGSKSKYASASNVKAELDWCRRLYADNPQWNVVDTTNAGIEEISADILNILGQKGVKPRFVNENPSAI